MAKEITSKQANSRPRDDTISISLPDIGLGTMRTSATYAAALIQLEGDRFQQVDVLDSVMEALGISPEEIIHNRKKPDGSDVEGCARWNDEMDRLEALGKRK